jgi:hypothetical protein
MRKPRSPFKLQDVQRAVNSQKFRVTGQFPVSVNQIILNCPSRHGRRGRVKLNRAGLQNQKGLSAISHQKARTWLWHTLKRIARYPDIAWSIRGTIFAPGYPAFHGVRLGQG